MTATRHRGRPAHMQDWAFWVAVLRARVFVAHQRRDAWAVVADAAGMNERAIRTALDRFKKSLPASERREIDAMTRMRVHITPALAERGEAEISRLIEQGAAAHLRAVRSLASIARSRVKRGPTTRAIPKAQMTAPLKLRIL